MGHPVQGHLWLGLEAWGVVLEDLLDYAVDLDEGPGGGDGLGLVLAGLVDEQGGAGVEAVAGGVVVFGGPGGEPVPGVDAPAVVAFDDEGGVVPAGGVAEDVEGAA